MLPKKHRLSKTADVNLTTAKGRSFFSQSFLIKTLTKPDLETPKVTVIVSVKISKSAVVRNRLKRVIRQAVHEYIGQIKPASYAFILKKTAVPVNSTDLKQEVIVALEKSKMISKTKIL